MIPKRRVFVITIIVLIVFVATTNYFMGVLSGPKSKVMKSSGFPIEQRILQKIPVVTQNYKIKRTNSDNITDTFIRNLKTITKAKSLEQLWKEANSWVSKTQLYNFSSSDLGSVLHALKTATITKADIDARGTQLKLLLTLEGQQQAVFKPKWYPIEKVIEGPVYAGKDRYFSEIVAFYLSGVLAKPFTPLTTERKLSLKYEIVPVATDRLLDTIFEHNSATCVYGKCFYCKREDPVCEDSKGMLTGAIIFNVDAQLKNNRSPWQRTYKRGKKALWETSDNYCKSVKTKLPMQRILDLIDTSVFDFLIQNGDRHHYETLEDNVILIDNGKGLGNPNVHHLDILAPLYQCCILRSNTWKRLEQLSGGLLRKTLEEMPDIHNFITNEHLSAIEQRLVIIYAAVEYCRTRNKIENDVL